MKFPYQERPRSPSPAFPEAKTYLAPFISIIVKNGDKEVEVDALADSGASGCLFPGMLGIALGIDVYKGPIQAITGLGNKEVTAHFHKIRLRLGKEEWEAYAGFSFDYLGATGLLGQRSFFDHFRVIFDYQTECIIVNKRTISQKILTLVGQ